MENTEILVLLLLSLLSLYCFFSLYLSRPFTHPLHKASFSSLHINSIQSNKNTWINIYRETKRKSLRERERERGRDEITFILSFAIEYQS